VTNLVKDFPVDQLMVDERLELLARLWDSLLQNDDPQPVPEWHLDLLRSRLASADANPQASISLEELRTAIRPNR